MNATAPTTHAATLANIDGYLAALQYDATHPWRMEIAAALALPKSTDIVVCAPYSVVHIPMWDADDHAVMKAKQLAYCLRHMPVGAYSEPMVLLARRLADELVLAVRTGSGAALLIGQLDDILMSIEGDAGPCDVLWMCQQLANEVQETVIALDAEKAAPAIAAVADGAPDDDHEQQLLAAYRKSDERGRSSILDWAVSMAEDWPAPRAGVGAAS